MTDAALTSILPKVARPARRAPFASVEVHAAPAKVLAAWSELEAVALWAADRHDPQKSPLAAFLAALLAKKAAAFFAVQDPVRLQREWDDEQRKDGYAGWEKAVERTLDWVDVD